MRKILILYATRQGQTAKVATRVRTHLEQAGAIVECVDARDKAATSGIDLDTYDRLVFGASMHAGGIEAELADFINANGRKISAKPHTFFLVLLSAATRDPHLRERWLTDARAKVDAQLEVAFDDLEMIAGALSYSKYPLPLKWLMRRIAKQAGGDTDVSHDYEYTDWDQVERFARRLLE